MAKKKQRKSRKKKNSKSNRNFVAVAMNKRNVSNGGPMKDKRLKRKNRNTWKKDESNVED
jgi:hypothetical protein